MVQNRAFLPRANLVYGKHLNPQSIGETMDSRSILIAGLVFSLSACGPSGDEAQPSQNQATRFTLPSSAIVIANQSRICTSMPMVTLCQKLTAG